jgi:hypothetical protein
MAKPPQLHHPAFKRGWSEGRKAWPLPRRKRPRGWPTGKRADALRAKLAATPAPYAAPRANPLEERAPAERERAARAKESARREARRRTRDFEARTTYGYAPEPRRPSYPDQFLTMRDRASP